jgi:hypothetical protein
MRALVFGALALSASLFACNQDLASSNAGRDTHMGDIHAGNAPAGGSATRTPESESKKKP